MTKPTALLICPGRGSYGREELGSIAKLRLDGPALTALQAADAQRAADGRPTVTELDAATQFRPGAHLLGANAAELIYFATVFHAQRLAERYEIVAVAGNSMGWYSALACAGALTPLDGWRLIVTMAGLQDQAQGGQILTTLVDDTWRDDPVAHAAVERALTIVNSGSADQFAAYSIRLGGHAVLAGTESGVQSLLRELPKVRVGEREFPFRLAGHGPFHTPLCAQVSASAQTALADLAIDRPQVHLIDGRGNLHTPWSADPEHLLDYTTTTQVVETFDFTAAIRTALREFNPEVLLCAAPGSALRAPVGHVVIREGYAEIMSKAQLFESDLIRLD